MIIGNIIVCWSNCGQISKRLDVSSYNLTRLVENFPENNLAIEEQSSESQGFFYRLPKTRGYQGKGPDSHFST